MSKEQIFDLAEEEELRIEVDCGKDEVCTVELRSGLAEVFGTELVKHTKYTFKSGAKFAVYTYHGCQIAVSGKLEVQPYKSKETPMTMYLNVHAGLEQMRPSGNATGAGPVVMIVGPGNVGKTTLARLLLNYAVRFGRRPLYVDLDVGQGNIGIPGTIGSVLVERPASVEDGFMQTTPLMYHFGHLSPGDNMVLFNKLVSRLADVIRERIQTNRKIETSGVIINTCGWVRGEGYNVLKHVAKAFEVDVVLVLDQERTYNDLVRDLPDFVKVVLLPKSGGVVQTTKEARVQARDSRIKDYFYGPRQTFFPHSFEVKFSDLQNKIFKVGSSAVPVTCLPFGQKAEDNQTKLFPVALTPRGLNNHILSVTFSDTVEDVILNCVAGFICVTDVDVDGKKLTVMSPQPKPLPSVILLLSDLQYVDSG